MSIAIETKAERAQKIIKKAKGYVLDNTGILDKERVILRLAFDVESRDFDIEQQNEMIADLKALIATLKEECDGTAICN